MMTEEAILLGSLFLTLQKRISTDLPMIMTTFPIDYNIPCAAYGPDPLIVEKSRVCFVLFNIGGAVCDPEDMALTNSPIVKIGMKSVSETIV